MDIQSIITFIIIAAAAGFAAYRLWRIIHRANNCSPDTPLYCEGCALKEHCKSRSDSQKE